MVKRGPKPKRVVDTKWSSNLAYAVGLIATDGCLVKDSTLIDLTSKDIEQLKNFNTCLNLRLKVGKKLSGNKEFCRVQFKNRLFYDFLISIGLTPAKSKTISKIDVPDKYFFDFLRGCFDGDGCIYSYWDKRWKSSFMFYVEFVSASEYFISWIRKKLKKLVNIEGHITGDGRKVTLQLKYAKKESLVLLRKMYHSPNIIYLSRKRLKIERILSIVGELI